MSPTLKPWLSAHALAAIIWSSRRPASVCTSPTAISGSNTLVIVAGSTPVAGTESPPPCTLAWSKRIGETTLTPGTSRSCSETPAGTGEKPSSWVTISAARLYCSSTSLSIEPRRPAAKIAVKTTSASPIISADAVIAVRCGWRSAFSRASRPGMPWMRSSGRPISRASGRTSTGASTATPRIITIMPRPSREAVAVPPAPPNSPPSRASRPMPMTSVELISRLRLTCRAPSVDASRIASSGSTCVARRAGTKPDTSVAIMPTARPTMIVRAAITVPVEGSSSPNEASSPRRPGASSRPPTMPSTEAMKPMISVSNTTDVRICRREAPSVRRSANSFDRCATVTANVLKIRKPPTNTAMPANTSSAMVRKPERLVDVAGRLLRLLLAGAHDRGVAERLRDRAP